MNVPVEIGETVIMVLPWSEVCMHMGVAGQRWRIAIDEVGAQILNDDGTPFSFPITHGEAGLRVKSYDPLVLERYIEE